MMSDRKEERWSGRLFKIVGANYTKTCGFVNMKYTKQLIVQDLANNFLKRCKQTKQTGTKQAG